MLKASTLVLFVCSAMPVASGLVVVFRCGFNRRALPLGGTFLFSALLPLGLSFLSLEWGELYRWGLLLILTGVFCWIGFLSYFATTLGLPSEMRVSRGWRNYTFFNLALGLIVPCLYLATGSGAYSYVYEGGGYLVVSAPAKYLLGYLLLALTPVLVRFEALYRSAAEQQKRHLRPLLLLCLLHLFPVAFLCCLGILYGAISFGILLAASLFVGLSSPLLLVTTLKKRALTLEVEIKPQVAYSSVAIFALGGYLLFLALVAEAVRRLGGDLENLFTFFGALLLFLVLLALPLSASLRERLSSFVRLNLLSASRDYRREWSQLSDSLATVSEVGEIGKTACETLQQFFRPEWVAFYLLPGEACQPEAYLGAIPAPTPLHLAPTLKDWIFRNGRAVRYRQLPEELRFEKGPSPEVVSPLLVAGQLVGLVFLGKKKAGGDYSSEELSLLDTSCRQIAVATLQSLTWRKLSESERLASFHQTASFVLHDLKNAVSTLSLLVNNAPRLASDPEAYRQGIKSIKSVSDRMQSLIHKLSSDLGQGRSKLGTVDLVPLIEEVLYQTGGYSDAEVIVERDLPSRLEVRTDPDMIKRVVHNLLVNAYESMPQGGKLTVSLFAEQGKASLSVKDTGVGMSAEFVKKNLFRPFQSTKRRGLGIGLYQCKKLLETLGGTIEVKSTPDRGTEFVVRVPLPCGRDRGELLPSFPAGEVASS